MGECGTKGMMGNEGRLTQRQQSCPQLGGNLCRSAEIFFLIFAKNFIIKKTIDGKMIGVGP